LTLMDVARLICEFLSLPPPALAGRGDCADPPTNLKNPVHSGSDGSLYLTVSEDCFQAEGRVREESYELSVDAQAVVIVAGSPRGMLWAFQTLRQMLPVEVEQGGEAVAAALRAGTLVLPTCRVRDGPLFRWRGSMLDVARHFMPKDMILRHIEVLSLAKLNVLHLHLTDDQGWRIPIDAFPKLKEAGWRPAAVKGVGGVEDEGGNARKLEGGAYSKEDLREIVAHARRWGVTVVPEIELPGHCNAALWAYPNLSCTGGPFELEARWGVYEDVLCVGKEAVFEFLEAVLAEVMGIFPSPWIHCGGDEVPMTRWRACPACQHRIRAESLRDEAQV